MITFESIYYSAGSTHPTTSRLTTGLHSLTRKKEASSIFFKLSARVASSFKKQPLVLAALHRRTVMPYTSTTHTVVGGVHHDSDIFIAFTYFIYGVVDRYGQLLLEQFLFLQNDLLFCSTSTTQLPSHPS